MEEIYGIDSFNNGDGYFLANEIAFRLNGGEFEQWKNLGPASSQSTLTLAGSLVEQGNPVVVAWSSDENHGHVNILLPGGLSKSSTWGLDVPNSANMSLDDINKSYVGCRLSWAFDASKKNQAYLFTVK